MGLLDKILGRGGAADDTPGPFDCERVKAAIGPLATALGALADAMDTDGAPMSNPGWSGRVRDLRNASGQLRMLASRPSLSERTCSTCRRSPLYCARRLRRTLTCRAQRRRRPPSTPCKPRRGSAV